MADPSSTIVQREAPELEARKLGLIDQAKLLTEQPPAGGLPPTQFAGPTQNQNQAFDLANKGIGSYQPFIDQAQGSLNQSQQFFNQGAGPITQDQVSSYLNPQQDHIQGEINRSFDQQGAKFGLDSLGSPGGPSAYGGGRATLLGSEIERNRADALARSEADNYANAQRLATEQQGRYLGAGAGLGNLAGQQAGIGKFNQDFQTSDIRNLSNLGEQERLLQQGGFDANQANLNQDIYEPYKRLSYYSDILGLTPSSQQQVSQQHEQEPSKVNQLLGGLTAGIGVYGAGQQAGLF